jgi:RimJ/RimL family protein N-acetyltransferase
MTLLGRAARGLLGDYELYRIYRVDLPTESREHGDLTMGPIDPVRCEDQIDDEALRRRVARAGAGSPAFGAWKDGRLVAGVWFLTPERFRREMNFWNLEPDAVWFHQVEVAERWTGRGYGTAVTRYGTNEMVKEGYRRAYCRIWHSHHRSVRVFVKAGWKHVGWVMRARPLGIPLRFSWRKERS